MIQEEFSFKDISYNVRTCMTSYGAKKPVKLKIVYEGCSNMNASSFITFYTYMVRQNVIPFWKELFVAFKMAPTIKKHQLYFLSYRPLYKGHSCILKFFEANCNARFCTCADIVSYLRKF